jgi:hypothetical protein
MIFPEGPRTFKVGDENANFTQVDRLTFRIGFREPFRPSSISQPRSTWPSEATLASRSIG